MSRQLFEDLNQYTGDDPMRDVLRPWLSGSERPQVSAMLDPVRTPTPQSELPSTDGDNGFAHLANLYALGRVNDVMIGALASTLSIDQYAGFWTELGMQTRLDAHFDPFFHEIVAVESSPERSAPPTIDETVRPGLLLDRLLFSRQGVRVRAGADHLTPGVADQSCLYWTFRRPGRLTEDESYGWGANSQWSTAARRDYLTDTAFEFNFDGRYHPDSEEAALDTPQLSAQERIDVLQHRCLVRDAPDGEIFPYSWKMARPRAEPQVN